MDNLSPEKLAEFKAAFEIFDKKRTGKITWVELGSIFKDLGQNLSQKDLKEMINEVDIEGNGYLNFEDFISMIVRSIRDNETEEELIEAFKTFDKDGNGYFTSNELHSTLKNINENLTQEEIDFIMKDADDDGDGQVNFEDFIKFMK